VEELKSLLLFQASYYIISGLWPVFHIRSFIAITGHKTDIWLVKTVGALISVIALTFFSALASMIDYPVVILAIFSALVLCIIDIYYSLSGRISKIYLLDAIVELFLVLLWLKFFKP
jgi:hypothetical protein